MRDFTLKKWLLAVLLLLMPWVANAAGFGRLTVLSALGQPFDAEVDLVAVQKDELSSLSVRLASPNEYRQSNLDYSAVVSGLRFSIEKRPNGQPFIKITSVRPVNEPFVDLLVELSWSSGRILREYTALIDPPDLAPAPVAVPEPPPAPALQPPPAIVAQPVEKPEAAAGSYGPIQRGETLSRIAGSLKPEGVTLEQMLLGLLRSNPEAFIRKNMNLVRSGKILRVPDKDELAAIPQREAMKEYRAQVADWNAYRQKLADMAGMAPEGRTAAKGRITPRIEDKATAEAKDVVRLSKGEMPGGAAGATKVGPRSMPDRIRMLEEEVVAREKALTEANERIAQLEKTIKDMQRLAEIKSPGLAAAQQQAEAKFAPKPEAAKPEPKPEAAKPELKPEAVKPALKPEAPKPEAKPKAPPPPPPPQPDLLDTLMDPLYLGAGGGIILLAGLGYWLMRRRRAPAGEEVDRVRPPTLRKAAAVAPGPAATVAVSAVPKVAPAVVAAAPAAEVDPLDEARVYLSHGRDAQAEAILKEALDKNPNREDVQVKLLEIYALRKDKTAFGKLAGDFNKLTRGQGENWLKVAAMGFALDSGNRLYAAGRDAPAAAPLEAEPAAIDLDFNLDASATGGATPDIALDVKAEPAAERSAEPSMPDFKLEIPSAESRTDIVLEARAPTPAADSNVIDFNVELPKIDVPEAKAAGAAAQPDQATDLDIKLDFGDLNLNVDDKVQAAGGGKDAHWYDVQTKFDLAKAYEEMGDKAGARGILQEVIKEGDAEQQAQAKTLLETLG